MEIFFSKVYNPFFFFSYNKIRVNKPCLVVVYITDLCLIIYAKLFTILLYTYKTKYFLGKYLPRNISIAYPNIIHIHIHITSCVYKYYIYIHRDIYTHTSLYYYISIMLEWTLLTFVLRFN